MQALLHHTKDGDRWDLLAWQYYGDTAYTSLIIEANPHLALEVTIPSGNTVLIPLVEAADAIEDIDKLPPWKR